MTQRIAAALSLVVFATCVWAGIEAGNPFGTVLARAMLAMLGALVIGLILGAMAQKMLEENLKKEEEKIKNGAVSTTEDGR
jgi:uncharacterized integral membrane protein